MSRIAFALFAAISAGAVCPAGPASAMTSRADPPQTFEYKIKHALYGDIGTYINTVIREGERTSVLSTMRIAVKVLGVTVYRQEADRSETWQGDRLESFLSSEHKNGERLEVRGQARGDAFVITAPSGTFVAPSHVRPSNPWSADILAANVMMSTSSGRVFHARVRGGEEDVVSVEGRTERLRRFAIDSDKREYVWLDSNDVPVAFRTETDGTPVDFVLHRYPDGAPGLSAAALPETPGAPAGSMPQYAEGDR